MNRIINKAPMILIFLMLGASFAGPPYTMLKLISLFTTIWMLSIMVARTIHHEGFKWDILMVFAAAATVFTWSMGWLS